MHQLDSRCMIRPLLQSQDNRGVHVHQQREYDVVVGTVGGWIRVHFSPAKRELDFQTRVVNSL